MVCRRWKAVLKLTSSVLAFRCSVGPKSSSRAFCTHHPSLEVLCRHIIAEHTSVTALVQVCTSSLLPGDVGNLSYKHFWAGNSKGSTDIHTEHCSAGLAPLASWHLMSRISGTTLGLCQLHADEKPFMPCLLLAMFMREGTRRTFRASATLRTASVAAPPLAAKPDTCCFRPGTRSPTVPSGAFAAGARLSPASHDAYEPVLATTLVS